MKFALHFAALLALVFPSSHFDAQAASRVVVLNFVSPSNGSYTVPAGKVLLIEHLISYFQSAGSIVVEIAAPAENIPNQVVTVGWQFSSTNRQTYTLAHALRANAGSTVTALPNTLPNNGGIYIEGLLVDQGDLYAANLDVKTEAVSVADGRLTETVRLNTPRPVVFSSSVSSDLATWAENLSQLVTKLPQPGIYDISTTLAPGDDREFLTVSAKTPEIR